MSKGKAILIGYTIDGGKNGIDKYVEKMLVNIHHEERHAIVMTTHATEEQKKRLAQYDAELVEIPTLLHPIRQYRCIQRLIQSYDIGEVYVNLSESFNSIPVIVGKKEGVKTVLHSHSSAASGRNIAIRMIRTLIHYAFRPVACICADKLIACSGKAGQWMFGGREYVVAVNQVDKEKFKRDEEKREKIRKEMGLDEKFVIMHVGAYSYAKNQDFLVKVMKELGGRLPIVLLMAGTGTDCKELKEKITKAGVENIILALGPRSDIPDLLQAADLFVLPSRFEGQPVVTLEAQAAGLPVFISDKVSKDGLLYNDLTVLGIRRNDTRLWAEEIEKASGA